MKESDKEKTFQTSDKESDIEKKLREVRRRKLRRENLLPSKDDIRERTIKKNSVGKDGIPENVRIAQEVKKKILKKNMKEDISEKIARTHHELFPDVDINIEKNLSVTPTSPFKDITLNEEEREDEIGHVKIEENEYVKKKTITDKLTEISKDEVIGYVEKEISDKSIFVSRILAGLADFLITSAISYFLLYLATQITGGEVFTRDFITCFLLIFFTFFFFYSTFFLTLSRQTLGMMLGEVKLKTDGDFGVLKAFLRTFFYFFSIFFFGIGLVWGIFSKKRQCWHDIIVDCQVVRDK